MKTNDWMQRDVLFSVVCLVAATLLNLFKGDNEVISDKASHSISARDRFGDSSSYYRVREHPRPSGFIKSLETETSHIYYSPTSSLKMSIITRTRTRYKCVSTNCQPYFLEFLVMNVLQCLSWQDFCSLRNLFGSIVLDYQELNPPQAFTVSRVQQGHL